MSNTKTYEAVTNAILEQLEKGSIPWKRPWTVRHPKNYVTKKTYRGMNFLLLSMLPYSSPYFMSKKQIEARHGTIKDGEKPHEVVYVTKIMKDAWDEKKQQIVKKFVPILKISHVYNLEQVYGLKLRRKEKKLETVECTAADRCQQVIDAMPERPEIVLGGNRACYSPTEDRVTVPVKEQFSFESEFFCTMFHELAHSTGHEKRLDRPEITKKDINFGSEDYSKEELVAELTASFLCAECNMERKELLENSTAYIQSWIKALKNDKTMVIRAAALAQKASDFILNK